MNFGQADTLTLPQVGLCDLLPNDVTGIVHQCGRVELHHLADILLHNVDFECQRHLGGGYL